MPQASVIAYSRIYVPSAVLILALGLLWLSTFIVVAIFFIFYFFRF